ncbi:MAG: Crp/Fnr family transcriptional regulator [Dehalococcoidia bacterium]|nr:Crp/Fnr family transcriptional regulator [Dehalococcoidia bacterium]
METDQPAVEHEGPTGPHALFLDGLDQDTRERFIERAVRRRFDVEEMILHEGEPGAGLFVTTRGLVKVFKTSVNGREQVLRYAPSGSSFNEVTVLDGGVNPTSAQAVTSTEVLIISRQLMSELGDNDVRVNRAIVDSMSGLYRHLMQMVEDLSFRHVSERVARVLLQSVMPRPGVGAGVDMHRRLTQSEIAEMIGSTREVVGRALRELEDAGAIRVERGVISLVDASRLES